MLKATYFHKISFLFTFLVFFLFSQSIVFAHNLSTDNLASRPASQMFREEYLDIKNHLDKYSAEGSVIDYDRLSELLMTTVRQSQFEKSVTFHNALHWDELIFFMTELVESMSSRNRFSVEDYYVLLDLIKVATAVHDIGYYLPADQQKPQLLTPKGHEARSQQFISEHFKEVGLPEEYLEAVVFLIEMTKFEVGEDLEDRMLVYNDAIVELNQFRQTKEESDLSEGVKEFLKSNFPMLYEEARFDLLLEILYLGKGMAVADIYFHSQQRLALIVGIWEEFKHTPGFNEAPNVFEQIAMSYDFAMKEAYEKRLRDHFIPADDPKKTGIWDFISIFQSDLKRDWNLTWMQQIKAILKKESYQESDIRIMEQVLEAIDPYLTDAWRREIRVQLYGLIGGSRIYLNEYKVIASA